MGLDVKALLFFGLAYDGEDPDPIAWEDWDEKKREELKQILKARGVEIVAHCGDEGGGSRYAGLAVKETLVIAHYGEVRKIDPLENKMASHPTSMNWERWAENIEAVRIYLKWPVASVGWRLVSGLS